MKTALDELHELQDEASRRVRAVKALPLGSQEREAEKASFRRWREEVMRPRDAELWPRVVAAGDGFNL